MLQKALCHRLQVYNFKHPDAVAGPAGPSDHRRDGEGGLRARPSHRLVVQPGEMKERGPWKLSTQGSLWLYRTAKANGRTQHLRSPYPSPAFLVTLTRRSIGLSWPVPVLQRRAAFRL